MSAQSNTTSALRRLIEMTMKRLMHCMALLSSVLAVVAAGPAAAQALVGVGDRTVGALEVGDRVTVDGRLYDCYRLRASRHAWISISLYAPQFDGTLEVGRGGSCDFDRATASNDDGASPPHAELVLRPRSGVYSIRVSSYDVGETGDYSLKVESGSAPRTDPPDPFRNAPSLPFEQYDLVRPQALEARYQWDAMCVAANWVTRHERVVGPPVVPGQVEEETAMLNAALAESARLAGHSEEDARDAWGGWTRAAMILGHDRGIRPAPGTIPLQRACVKQLHAASRPQDDSARPTN